MRYALQFVVDSVGMDGTNTRTVLREYTHDPAIALSALNAGCVVYKEHVDADRADREELEKDIKDYRI